MNENSLPWDDLRIVLAIARGGSLAAAARAMKTSHATMFRRLNDIERNLGVRLFDRSRTGYSPTTAGEDLAATAARVEDEIVAAERRLSGQDSTISGVIRITTTDTLLAGLVSPILAAFQRQEPQIRLEVVVSNQLLDLTRRDADVAIRPSAAPPQHLVGRKIGIIQQAVYQHKDQCGAFSETTAAITRWVGPDTNMGYRALETWMSDTGADQHCHYRLDTMLGMLLGVRDNIGAAVLPCYLAEADPQLVRTSPFIPDLATDVWALTHPDLRGVARIRALLDFVVPRMRGKLLEFGEKTCRDGQ